MPQKQDDKIEITPEMVEAGVAVYKRWEQENVFDEDGVWGEGNIKELITNVYRVMSFPVAFEKTHREIGKPQQFQQQLLKCVGGCTRVSDRLEI